MSTHITTFNPPSAGRPTIPTKPVRLISFGNSPPPTAASPLGSPPPPPLSAVRHHHPSGGGGVGSGVVLGPESPMVLVQTAAYSSPPPSQPPPGGSSATLLHPAAVSSQSHIYIEVRGTAAGAPQDGIGGVIPTAAAGTSVSLLPPHEPDYLSPDGGGGGNGGGPPPGCTTLHQLTDIKTEPLSLFSPTNSTSSFTSSAHDPLSAYDPLSSSGGSLQFYTSPTSTPGQLGGIHAATAPLTQQHATSSSGGGVLAAPSSATSLLQTAGPSTPVPG